MKITRKTLISFVAAAALVATAGLTVSAQGYGQGRGRGRDREFTTLLSGTYELDRTQGDDPTRAAEMATRYLPPQQRDNAMRMMLARLQAPAQISIIRRGNSVTVSSTNGPQTTFVADGQTRRENYNYGDQGGYGGNRRQSTMSTRAVFVGDKLTVTSQGNRATDFTVIFDPTDGGNRLIVTRQIWSGNSSTPITARAIYSRVAAEPRWDIYNGGNPGGGYPRDNRGGNVTLLVPQGTRMTAVLDTPIDTRNVRGGERFSMTVQGPNEYRDARIEGVIRGSNSYNDGRPTDLRIDFDTIRLRNGQTGQLDATIEGVRTSRGDTYRVDGGVRDNRDNNAVQNGAIGAAIGGVLGVLAGGAKGAAIGAVVGGAVGAGGSILANQNERFLVLPAGTEVTILTGYRTTGGQ